MKPLDSEADFQKMKLIAAKYKLSRKNDSTLWHTPMFNTALGDTVIYDSLLHEGEVFPAIACEHAPVILKSFCLAVACQNGF